VDEEPAFRAELRVEERQVIALCHLALDDPVELPLAAVATGPAANCSRLPIPAGLVEGLPVGMQIIGRRGADEAVLAASAAFERMRPWEDAYRRCAERALCYSAGWR
jgi:Asp-tRNA(Asn)/Glu-tRNA(Gln) amidotransferase A subunit family amidase